MFTPTSLNLPEFPFRLKEEAGTVYIFDEVRKKYLVLTPEEWVRQHFVQYLIGHKSYPKGLIRLEGGLKLHSMQKRSDIITFNTTGQKILLVECKAPSVKITQAAFDQVARYNMVHQTALVAVTNGLQHYCCEIDHLNRTYRFTDGIPAYVAYPEAGPAQEPML